MSPSGFIDPAKFRLAFTLLETLTRRIWTRLRYSQEYAVSHGEETITDVTLLDLRMIIDRLKIGGIDVWKCAEGWEPHIGIDWMWYVGSPSRGWLRFAVQAKKLHLGSSLYKSLGHEVRPGVRQLDILERFARWAQATPLYSLYNYLEFEELVPEWCGRSPEDCSCLADECWHCCQPFDRAQFGCTLASSGAARLALEKPTPPAKRFHRSRKRFTFLHREGKAVPWRCLLCPNYMSLLTRLPNGNLSHPRFGEMTLTYETPESMIARLDHVMDFGNRDDLEDLLGGSVGPRMMMRIDADRLAEQNVNVEAVGEV